MNNRRERDVETEAVASFLAINARCARVDVAGRSWKTVATVLFSGCLREISVHRYRDDWWHIRTVDHSLVLLPPWTRKHGRGKPERPAPVERYFRAPSAQCPDRVRMLVRSEVIV